MKIALESCGVESTSYWRGAATIDYAHLGDVIALVVGVGKTECEAADDAIEQLAQVADLPQGLLDNVDAHIKGLPDISVCEDCEAGPDAYTCTEECEMFYHTVTVLYEEADM